MNNGHYSLPMPINEPVLTYAPVTPERVRLKEVLTELKSTQIDIPMHIAGGIMVGFFGCTIIDFVNKEYLNSLKNSTFLESLPKVKDKDLIVKK